MDVVETTWLNSNGNLHDFKRGIVVEAISRVYRERSEKEKISSDLQLSGVSGSLILDLRNGQTASS